MLLIFTVIIDVLQILSVLVIVALVGVAVHHLLALSVGHIPFAVFAIRLECSGSTLKTLCISSLSVNFKLSLSTGFNVKNSLLFIVDSIDLVAVEFRPYLVVSEKLHKVGELTFRGSRQGLHLRLPLLTSTLH